MALSRSRALALQGGIRPSLLPLFTPTFSVATAFAPALRKRRALATVPAPAEPRIHDESLLAAQRLRRPVSPHLSVYSPAQTWFGSSIWNRITGTGLTGVLYIYAAAYLVAPLTGWHLETASLAEAFGSLPVAIKGGLKFLVAWPFAFHLINSVRHLVWDTAYGFAKNQIRIGGWVIWGASLAIGAYLGFVV